MKSNHPNCLSNTQAQVEIGYKELRGDNSSNLASSCWTKWQQ